jgi:hypothetical protein
LRIVDYTPEHFDMLYPAARRMQSLNLTHRDFVNHYYASSGWCKLHLLLSPDDAVIGAVGIERMPFRYGAKDIINGFATNYHSLEPGAGGFLFLHWLKSCTLGIALGASEDSHKIYRSQGWTYFDGVGVFLLNKPYEIYRGDPLWKQAAKTVARHITGRAISNYSSRIPSEVERRISVQEETRYTDDLIPRHSPFEFRFSPGADYLAWRYNLDLSFVRYRLFRIIEDGRSAGYVILNENPHRILVSQCDGDNAESLAWGVLLSVLAVGREDRTARTAMLTSCHPQMQQVYRSFGFKMDHTHPLALGSLRRGIVPPAGADTSNWLINYDWGDNGLMEFLEPGNSHKKAQNSQKALVSFVPFCG